MRMPPSFMRSPVFPLLLITIAGLLGYANSLHSSFHFDDNRVILENPATRKPSADGHVGLPSPASRRYVGEISFVLNERLHGRAVAGYHLVNTAVHIVNGMLVYTLVALLFRTPVLKPLQVPDGGSASLIALFSSLLFVTHPVQTQAVTYIAQRFTSLAAAFSLASLVLYIRWRLLSAQEGERAKWRAGLYGGSVLAAVLAMKTKETAFTLPFAVMLTDFLFFSAPPKKRLLIFLPFCLTLLIIPAGMLGTAGPDSGIIREIGEATRVHSQVPRTDYLLTQSRVIMTYLRLLLFPINQNLDYDYPLYESALTPGIVLSAASLMLLAAGAVFFLFQSRMRPGFRLPAFGIIWFFLTLSVESSFFPIIDVIFEHRVYLPSVGLLTAVVSLLFTLRNTARRKASAWLLPSLFSSVACLLLVASYQRNTVWADEVTLWTDVVMKSPGKGRGHINLGAALHEKALETFANRTLLDRAVFHLETAVRLDPSSAEAYNNLGSAYSDKGRIDEAIACFEKSLELAPSSPKAHLNLGLAYEKAGHPERARQEIERAVSLDPGYREAQDHLMRMTGEKDAP